MKKVQRSFSGQISTAKLIFLAEYNMLIEMLLWVFAESAVASKEVKEALGQRETGKSTKEKNQGQNGCKFKAVESSKLQEREKERRERYGEGDGERWGLDVCLSYLATCYLGQKVTGL